MARGCASSGRISARVHDDAVHADVEQKKICVSLGSSISRPAAPPYVGEYHVVPRTYDTQVLPTARKLMTQDVTVEPIPQWITSNDSGGETLIIGEESL